jgi:hypothetical protein
MKSVSIRGVPAALVFLFLAAALHGQPNEDKIFSPLNSLNGKPQARFNAVCAAMAEHTLVKGDFVQTKTISRLGRSLVSKGFFIIDSGLGMVWDTRSPFPSIMAVGRDYIIQSGPDGKKTKLDAAGNETFLRISDTISAVFSGNAKKLADNFEIYFLEEPRSAGDTVWTIGLVPRDASIRTFASSIIMTGDSQLRTLVLNEQSGAAVRYELFNHSFPGALSPSEKNLFSL